MAPAWETFPGQVLHPSCPGPVAAMQLCSLLLAAARAGPSSRYPGRPILMTGYVQMHTGSPESQRNPVANASSGRAERATILLDVRGRSHPILICWILLEIGFLIANTLSQKPEAFLE
ncbi:hypothetical protein GCM10023081_39620 [Arthrobacter ginkgonis]|uniref:Uncharacterized protein n=1 Tax=Arthrobacter ginkgonis TaxID=1630594 RepID=A0ABP7CZM8_9MICC